MHIQLEDNADHAIQAYSDNKIKINSITYEDSLIVSSQEIITDINLNCIAAMAEGHVQLLMSLNPELIIIGHNDLGLLPPIDILNAFAKLKIGFECMSIGAACRTYNVLLSESRNVVGGFILQS